MSERNSIIKGSSGTMKTSKELKEFLDEFDKEREVYKTKVEKLKCMWGTPLVNRVDEKESLCGKASDLYHCPYCGGGDVVILCGEHLKKHLADYAYKTLEIEE